MFSGSAATSTVRCCDCVAVIEYFNVRAYVCMVVNIVYKFLCVFTSIHVCWFTLSVRMCVVTLCVYAVEEMQTITDKVTLSHQSQMKHICVYIYLVVLHSHATAENDEKVVRLRREVLFSH